MLEQVKLNHIKIRTTLAGTSGGARATEGSRVIRARATEVRLYMHLSVRVCVRVSGLVRALTQVCQDGF